MIAGTFILMALNSIIFTIGVIVYHKLWIQRFGIQWPGGQHFYSLRQNISQLAHVLWQFDAEWIIKYTGNEGYMYLYFQREMLKLLMIYSIIAVLASIPVNVATSLEQGFFTKTTLSQNSSEFISWFQVCIIYIFSIGVIITVNSMRKELSKKFVSKAIKETIENDYDWLRLRTVHVRGLDISDRSGQALKILLDNFLRNKSGRVQEVMLIPDFEKLLELEIERQHAVLMKRLLLQEYTTPAIRWAPRKLLNVEMYEKKLEQIDLDVQKTIQTPIWNSGHAFVVLNSLESVEKVLYEYRPGLFKSFKLGISNLIEKFQSIQRLRAFSTTFNRFEDNEQAQHSDIVITKAVDPFDIVWGNVGGTRGFYFYRRIWLMLLAVLTLLFLTTPAALLATLETLDIFSFLDFSWTQNLPEPLSNAIKAYFPSLLILCLNQILLILIDIAAYAERHYSYSQSQISICNKAFVYLTLNMLIIPGLTIATANSIIKVLQDKEFILADLLGEMHLADSGAFFVNLLLQKTCYSSLFYLLRGPEIAQSYFSIWIATKLRNDLNSHDKWRRRESQLFQYGYFYALMISGFAIIMTFCSTVPLVLPAGLWFFLVKYIVDGLNLITVHGKETESSGQIISNVFGYVLVCVLFYQISMIGFFAISEHSFQSFLIFILFLITFNLYLQQNKPLYDLSNYDQEYYSSMPVVGSEAVYNWRKLYTHPLTILRE